MTFLDLSASLDSRTVGSSKRLRLYRCISISERFWVKVHKTDGCWIWTGSTDGHGYGQIREAGRGSRLLKAHRVSWVLHNGPLSDDVLVLHSCDNPPCVRPDHISPGTSKDNTQDSLKRGRGVFQKHPEKHPRGERVFGAKLTEEQVSEIRRLRAEGWTQTRLAIAFGVTQSSIWSILAGKTWQHTVGRGEVKASEELFG